MRLVIGRIRHEWRHVTSPAHHPVHSFVVFVLLWGYTTKTWYALYVNTILIRVCSLNDQSISDEDILYLIGIEKRNKFNKYRTHVCLKSTLRFQRFVNVITPTKFNFLEWKFSNTCLQIILPLSIVKYMFTSWRLLVPWFNSTCMKFMPWISNYTQKNYRM